MVQRARRGTVVDRDGLWAVGGRQQDGWFVDLMGALVAGVTGTRRRLCRAVRLEARCKWVPTRRRLVSLVLSLPC